MQKRSPDFALGILRHAGSWKGPGGLAALPLLVATILPLVARLWPEVLIGSQLTPDYPPSHPFGFRYSLDRLALLLVLLAGAGVGAWRGFPAWSYTWVVLAIISILSLVSALLPVLVYDALGSGAVTGGWLITSPYFTGGLLVLIFAGSRVKRGPEHPFFVAAIYLAFIALAPLIQTTFIERVPVQVMAAIAISIMIAAVQLVVVVAAVMHFLDGDARTRRNAVYVLIAVALLAQVLTGWLWVLYFPGFDLANLGSVWGGRVLSSWAFAAAALLITWALAHLFIRIRKTPAGVPAP